MTTNKIIHQLQVAKLSTHPGNYYNGVCCKARSLCGRPSLTMKFRAFNHWLERQISDLSSETSVQMLYLQHEHV